MISDRVHQAGAAPLPDAAEIDWRLEVMMIFLKPEDLFDKDSRRRVQSWHWLKQYRDWQNWLRRHRI